MTSDVTETNLNDYRFYRELVAYSQDEAHIHVRRSLFMLEVNSALQPYGGMKNWLIAHAIALAGIIIFGSMPYVWTEIISLCFGVVFASIVGLHNLTAFACDIYTFVKGQETEEYIYKKLVRFTFNKFGVFLLPIILVLITLLVSWRSLYQAHQIFGIVAITALAIFIINQLANSIKTIKDYFRVLATFLGQKSAIVKNKEELTISIYYIGT